MELGVGILNSPEQAVYAHQDEVPFMYVGERGQGVGGVYPTMGSLQWMLQMEIVQVF